MKSHLLTTKRVESKSLCFLINFLLLCFTQFANTKPVTNFFSHQTGERLPQSSIWDIKKNSDEYIWLAVENGVWRFDGIKTKKIYYHDKIVKQIAFSENGTLWALDSIGKLLKSTPNSSKLSIKHEVSKLLKFNTKYNQLFIGSNNKLWLSDNREINRIDLVTLKITKYAFNYDLNSKPIFISFDDDIWVGYKNTIYIFNKTTNQFEEVADKLSIDGILKFIDLNKDGSVFIATNFSVYKFQPKTRIVTKLLTLPKNSKSLSMETDNQGRVWVGTLRSGLYVVDKNGVAVNFKYNKSNPSSLNDDTVLSLFKDIQNNLWVGTFNGGLNRINLNNYYFGLFNDSLDSVHCLKSPTIYSILPISNEEIWIGSGKGLVKYNRKNSSCKHYGSDPNQRNTLSSSGIYSLFIDSKNIFWVGTGNGLNVYSLTNDSFSKVIFPVAKTVIYSISENAFGELLVGTSKGLYRKNKLSKLFVKVKSLSGLENSQIRQISKPVDGEILISSDNGLLKYESKNDSLEYFFDIFNEKIDYPVHSHLKDNDGAIWVGSDSKGLLLISKGKPIIQIDFENTKASKTPNRIYAMQIQNERYLWFATNKGLIKFNKETYQSNRFSKRDGLQGNMYIRGASNQNRYKEILFGGRKGLNWFRPNDIETSEIAPKVTFNEIFILGTANTKASSTSLDIDNGKEITLPFNKNTFSISFSALQYNDPERNQYAYKLSGIHKDWSHLSKGVREVTFVNLPSGTYQLYVKASNKDGLWNEKGEMFSITIRPAPWLTWWAYTIYVMLIVTAFYSYLYFRRKKDLSIQNELKLQVEIRTQEIESQRQTIEKLLDKKNILFTNISHELKTPLTLVLGYISILKNRITNDENRNKLIIAERNALRLSRIVDQLLNLSKTSGLTKQDRANQNVVPILNSLVESFQIVAKRKNILLKVECISELILPLTDSAFESILGNLLSNALKYTDNGGIVRIVLEIKIKEKVILSVFDNGSGIDEQDLDKIFYRFERSEKHVDISGSGIGLALVKELVEVNDATISVSSTRETGTCFNVIWNYKPDLKVEANTSIDRDMLTTLVQSSDEPNISNDQTNNLTSLSNNKENGTILIVEDNPDMRDFIALSLQKHFHCIVARNGQEGIALALSHVPDLIISDVMMPIKSGIELSRIIRNDIRTSHIPVILLTAKNDKETRLSGLREFIDAYLTKPFNAEELNLQVKSLLTIRKLLRRQQSEKIKITGDLEQINLSKKDREFLNRIQTILENHYSDLSFSKAKLADLMAVSERQFQRKLKAIIDYNVADYIRDYRLSKAMDKIKNGYQISIVSDDCGFSSPAHFTRCFKTKYGLTPKKFQSNEF